MCVAFVRVLVLIPIVPSFAKCQKNVLFAIDRTSAKYIKLKRHMNEMLFIITKGKIIWIKLIKNNLNCFSMF